VKPIRITGLDHIVLNITDIDQSLKFYTEVLGLQGERVDEFRAGKVGFPSVRINGTTIIDLFPRQNAAAAAADAPKPDGNLNHFCLVVEREDFAGIVEYLKERGVGVRQGPIVRWGAQGQATSVYFLDPDRNEIEIRCYDPAVRP
jgi:catechol 2,3-dioxygenase-like lactoylglutathione lyase family enzyme